MRVLFAGTPVFAATALEAIILEGHDVCAVVTQPDRPSGRGLKIKQSPVAQTAERFRVALLSKPATLREPGVQDSVRALAPEVIVVAAYGLMVPSAILEMPPLGCINIHASLLPRWRGAAPVQRAILAGDAETGISIMQMDVGLDTGPILLAEPVAIGGRDTAGTLTDALAALGARLVVHALQALPHLAPRRQDEASATYAPKISKTESRIDWARSNVEIDRQVRAFNPAPGAEASCNGMPLKVWLTTPIAGTGKPGEVLECNGDRWVVACGEGALRLDEVQKPGGRRLAASEFLRGVAIARGASLISH